MGTIENQILTTFFSCFSQGSIKSKWHVMEVYYVLSDMFHMGGVGGGG